MRAINQFLPWAMSTGIVSVLAGLAAPIASAEPPNKQVVLNDVKKSLNAFADYRSSKGFKIKYPQNWEKNEPTQGPVVLKFKTLNGLVSARITVKDLAPGTTLSEYTHSTLEAVKKFMAESNLPITIIGDSDLKEGLASEPAHQTIFTYQVQGEPLTARAKQILAIKDGRGYCFNYTAADASLYDDYDSVISAILKSFEWI